MADGQVNMQLATLPLAGGKPRPSVRTVCTRGFVGEPRTADESLCGNPAAESDLLVISTDVRMLKSQQLLEQQRSGENGFEIAWWMPGTQDQFRISGLAWLYHPAHADTFPGARLCAEHVHVGDGAAGAWTWARERMRVWAKHTPALRGTFAGPLLREAHADKNPSRAIELPAERADADDPAAFDFALDQFCLVVFEVDHVERIRIQPSPGARWAWARHGLGDWGGTSSRGD